MKIRDKSKEKLQEQAKGFLWYEDETGKITEIQRTEISKILGLNDSEKKGFLSRLSYKIGKNIDISNMHKVEKALKKEYPDFGELYKEYKKYLKAKHFCKKYRVYNGEILVEYLHSTDNFKALNTLKNGIGDSYRFEENHLYKLGKLIFEKFPDISNEQFKKILENLYYATAFVYHGYGVNPGYCNQLIDTLNFLIKEYPELGIEDLNLILESWYIKIENHNDNYGKEINVIGVVKIVFEELKNISISTHEKFGFLYVLLNLSSGLFKLDFVNLNDMKLLLEKYPNVGLGELFSLRYISSATYSSTSHPCTNCSLSSIFEKYPDITIYELITLFYQNASYSGKPECDIERINYGLITNIAPKNLEYLRYIFKIFPTDINIHDIKWIENLICNLYHILNHPEKFIIDKYPNVSSTRQLALLLDNSYHDEDFRWKEMFKYSYQNNNYYNFCEHYPNISSEDIEWLFKIFSQCENIELHCENLEIILDKYNIDLQTLANSKGLLDVLGQTKPGNLEIILNKYGIDLQTLTNSKGLLDVLRLAEPGNLEIILNKYNIDLQTLINSKGLLDVLKQPNSRDLGIILDKYDIDFQILINSKGLLDVLKQAEPDNLKIILEKYNIDLETLVNSKGLLGVLKRNNKNFLLELYNFSNHTLSEKSLSLWDLINDDTHTHNEIFENIENKDEINDDNWIDITGLYSVIEYFEDDQSIPGEIKVKIRELLQAEESKDFIYKKLFELLKKSLSDQSKLNDEEIALLTVLNKKGLWNMGQSESLAKFIYQINKLDKNYKFNKAFTEIKGGINKFINVHKKDSNELLNSFYQVSTSLLERSPAIYRNVVELLNKLNSEEQKLFYKEIFPLYNVELFLGGNPGQYKLLGKKVDNNVEGQLIPMHERIKMLLDKFDNDTKIDVNSLLLEEKNYLVENIKQLFKEKFGIKKIPNEFSKENIESIRWHSIYLSNMHDRDEEKSAVLGYYLALKLDGKRTEFRTGKDFDPSEYMEDSKVYILREYLSNRSERNSVYKLENIEENDKIFLQENESNTIIGNTNGITDRLKTIEGNIKTLLDDDIYSERQRIIKKYIDKNLGKLLAKQFQILSGKNIPLSNEENKTLSDLSSELGDNLTDINNIQKLQNECKSISAIVNFVNKILNENLPKEIQDFENLCKPSNEHLELLKKIGINLEDDLIISSNSYLTYIESGITKGKNKLTHEEFNSLNEYTTKVNKELTDLYGIKDRLTALYEDFKNKIIDKYFDNTELKERFESMSPYFFTKADVEKENIVSLMTNDLDIVIKNIRQCLGCKDKGCNNDTDLSFGCDDRFFITTSHKEGDTSFADELVTLLPRTPKEEGFTFVMDRIYGNNGSTDILLNNIYVILKKINKLSPNLKKQLSIFVPDGIGLTLNGEGIQKLEKGYNGISINKQEITVTIEGQPITDSYHEFGGIGCRDTGNATISGYLIRF